MNLSINGAPRETAAATISELLEHELEGGSQRGIAVAVNGEMVPRGQWTSAALNPDDRIEIVRALPGG